MEKSKTFLRQTHVHSPLAPAAAAAVTSTSTLFNGFDLATQPFLTKRGRKINHIVKRIFVILDGLKQRLQYYMWHASSARLTTHSFISLCAYEQGTCSTFSMRRRPSPAAWCR